jgi:hypothetical protein
MYSPIKILASLTLILIVLNTHAQSLVMDMFFFGNGKEGKDSSYFYSYDLNKKQYKEHKLDTLIYHTASTILNKNEIYYCDQEGVLRHLTLKNKKEKIIHRSKVISQISSNDSIVIIKTYPSYEAYEDFDYYNTDKTLQLIKINTITKKKTKLARNKNYRYDNICISASGNMIGFQNHRDNEPNNPNNCCNYTSFIYYSKLNTTDVICIDSAKNMKNQCFGELDGEKNLVTWLNDTLLIYKFKEDEKAWKFYKYNLNTHVKTEIDYGVKIFHKTQIQIINETKLIYNDGGKIIEVENGIKKIIWMKPARITNNPHIDNFKYFNP